MTSTDESYFRRLVNPYMKLMLYVCQLSSNAEEVLNFDHGSDEPFSGISTTIDDVQDIDSSLDMAQIFL